MGQKPTDENHAIAARARKAASYATGGMGDRYDLTRLTVERRAGPGEPGAVSYGAGVSAFYGTDGKVMLEVVAADPAPPAEPVLEPPVALDPRGLPALPTVPLKLMQDMMAQEREKIRAAEVSWDRIRELVKILDRVPDEDAPAAPTVPEERAQLGVELAHLIRHHGSAFRFALAPKVVERVVKAAKALDSRDPPTMLFDFPGGSGPVTVHLKHDVTLAATALVMPIILD